MYISDNYKRVKSLISNDKVTLVVVSKTHPVEKIKEVYDLGQRDFGENKVQEMVTKVELLPNDIRWHLIGHLQSNKVKYIAGFVHLIHSVDSLSLLKEINKQGQKAGRVIDCLLQIHIAEEETKFGLNEEEINELVKDLISHPLGNIRICGLMGMATNTEDNDQVRKEFKSLKALFDKLKTSEFSNNANFNILSMGMSGDYLIAIEEGGNMVRVGSAIFGNRENI
jgi:pyridoxal phosphate enzyme (YggS family)